MEDEEDGSPGPVWVTEEAVPPHRLRPIAPYVQDPRRELCVGDVVEAQYALHLVLPKRAARSSPVAPPKLWGWWQACITEKCESFMKLKFLADAKPLTLMFKEGGCVRRPATWLPDGTWVLRDAEELRRMANGPLRSDVQMVMDEGRTGGSKPSKKAKTGGGPSKHALTAAAATAASAASAAVLAAAAAGLSLADRCVPAPPPSALRAECLLARAPHPPALRSRVEFIAGRDTLVSASELAAGVSCFDPEERARDAAALPVLFSCHLPLATLRQAEPWLRRALQLYGTGVLKESSDHRAAAGGIDRPAFYATNEELILKILDKHSAILDQRYHGWRQWPRAQRLPLVVFVHPCGSGVHLGLPEAVTGAVPPTRPYAFGGDWKRHGLPFRSWSGGVKQVGGQAVPSVLSKRKELLPLQAQMLGVARAAWAELERRHPEAAERQKAVAGANALGGTGFTSWSFNLDFPTCAHDDDNNVKDPPTYSSLIVFEIGLPFCGCLYMLPQFSLACEARQGIVLFHRSGEPHVGLHGNSGLHLPSEDPSSHRAVIVFYTTRLPAGATAVAAAAAEEEEEEEEEEDVEEEEEDAE